MGERPLYTLGEWLRILSLHPLADRHRRISHQLDRLPFVPVSLVASGGLHPGSVPVHPGKRQLLGAADSALASSHGSRSARFARLQPHLPVCRRVERTQHLAHLLPVAGCTGEYRHRYRHLVRVVRICPGLPEPANADHVFYDQTGRDYADGDAGNHGGCRMGHHAGVYYGLPLRSECAARVALHARSDRRLSHRRHPLRFRD